VDFDVYHVESQINVFVDVRWFDANGTDVDGYVATSGPSGVVQSNTHDLFCLSAGTYFLSVQGPPNGNCNFYTLTAGLFAPPFALDAYNQTNGLYAGTLKLYDDAPNELNSYTFTIGGVFQADTTSNTYTRYCLGQGTYYLRVSSDLMCGLSYRLKWHFTPPAFSNDAESNNTTAEALVLEENTWASGHLNYDTHSDNVDQYRFDLPGDGVIRFDIDAYNQNLGTYPGTLELFDGALNSLNTYTFTIGGVFQPDTAFNTYTRFCLGQGTYYLHVSSDGMCGLSYRVRYETTLAPLSRDPDDNDTQAAALPVFSGVQEEGHLNFDVGDDNTDQYFFSVAGGGTPSLLFAASHQNGGTYYLPLTWFDSNGDQVGSYDYIVNGGSVFVDAAVPLGTLTEGTYYLALSSNACGTSYRFTMDGITTGVFDPAVPESDVRVLSDAAMSGLFHVQTNAFIPVRAEVLDAQGQLVFRTSPNGQRVFPIDLSSRSEGVYYLHLTDARGITAAARMIRIR
jgi:hypothetical protein